MVGFKALQEPGLFPAFVKWCLRVMQKKRVAKVLRVPLYNFFWGEGVDMCRSLLLGKHKFICSFNLWRLMPPPGLFKECASGTTNTHEIENGLEKGTFVLLCGSRLSGWGLPVTY